MKKLLVLLVFAANILAAEEFSNLQPVVEKLNTEDIYNRALSDEALNNTKIFLIEKFKDLNIEPLNGDLANTFKTKGGITIGENSVSFDVIVPRRGIPMNRIKPMTQNWEQEEDWLPLGFSDDGNIQEAEIAFAGYGISTPNYDDYIDIDASGKVVVVLADSPEGADSEKFKEQLSYSYKAKNAKKHGAEAIFFVKAMGDSANVFEPIMVDDFDSGIIALQVNRTSIERYFPKQEPLLDLEKKIRNEQKPQSLVLPRVKANINISFEEEEKEFTNISGIIEGDDTDRQIIIAFPYDEALSDKNIREYVEKEGKFYYPSGNNISGIAAALELARRFQTEEPAVNIIFAALSGDEPNMEGSKTFVENNKSLVSNARAVFYIDNTDKVHRNHVEMESNEPLIVNTARETEEFEKLNIKALELDNKDNTPLRSTNSKYARISNKKRSYPPPTRDWKESDYQDLLNYINMLEKTIRGILEN